MPTADGARTCAPTGTRRCVDGASRRRRTRDPLAARRAASGRWMGRGGLYRNGIPRRLLHQLRDVPPGLPAQRPGSLRRCRGVAVMSGLTVVTALRSEYAALAGRVPDATLMRCGMGQNRVTAWLPKLAAAA